MTNFEGRSLHTIFLLIWVAILVGIAVGCRTGIRFDPDFYVGDMESGGIVSERGDIVLSSDPAFNEYACLHREKVKELKRILMGKRIGANNRYKISQEYSQLVSRMSDTLKK